MEQKIIFREMLSEVKALADSRQNRLTTQEIDEFFANTHLSREQMELVYEYLLSQKIQVDGYQGKAIPQSETKGAEPENTGWEGFQAEQQALGTDTLQGAADAEKTASVQDEASYMNIMEQYLYEMERMEKADPKEELRLFHLAASGDKLAASRLVELYLPMVCELAGDYDGEDYPVEDLIQEGNVGLLLAVEKLEARESLAAYQVQLMNAVNQYMQDVLQEQKDIREMGEGIAQRVNHLNEAIHNLEEDLEHKVSVEELSAYLEMPAEEIRDILKMAGDELKVEGYEN